MHEVQEGVPIPKITRAGAAKRRKYPFEDMAVGAMFFAPGKTAASLGTHASKVGSALGRKFSVRSCTMRQVDDAWQLCEPEDKDAVDGVGVWRVE